MTRVDVVYADLSGVYIDGKWQQAEQVDCHCEDIPPRLENVYTLGSTTPMVLEHEPGRREWTVRLKVQDGIDIKINDPEIHFWTNQQDYRVKHSQYVIQEMTL